MRIFRVRKPATHGPPTNFTLFCEAVWEYLFNGNFPFQDSDTVKWNRGPNGYSAIASPGGAGGKSSVAGQFQGEWDPGATYSVQMWVIVSLGSNAGTYVYVNPSPSSGNAPWAGGGFWVQLPIGPASGIWM